MKKIIADSGCDLKTLQFNAQDISYEQVAFKVNVGDRVYVDDMNLDTEALMADLRQSKEKSCSACPSPQDWLNAYGDADEIYVFTTSGTLSGSHNGAVLAAEMLREKSPDAKVYIMDTLAIGGVLGLLVLKTKELLEQGQDFAAVCAALEKYRSHVDVYFMLDNIDNLVNNGRMKRAAGIAVNLLGINIILKPSDRGEVETVEKVRGTGKCLQKILKHMQKSGYNGGRVMIGCCQNRAAVAKMAALISEAYPAVQPQIVEMSGLCGYYSSITGLMVGFEHE